MSKGLWQRAAMIVRQAGIYASLLLCTTVGICQSGAQRIDSLVQAINTRDIPKAHALIKSGLDLNNQDRDGMSPLEAAINNGLDPLVAELIASGADPNFFPSGGDTPLMLAAFNCNLNIVALLLKHGSHINATSRDGETALMDAGYACWDGRVTRLLLQSGAKANLANKDGYTALMQASLAGNEEPVHVLVAAGVDVKITAPDGENALTLAKDATNGRTKAHQRIYAFLKRTEQR